MSVARQAFLSNTLGNTLEWYDFTLYGTLAPIIAQQFFPARNAMVSLIITFGAFAAGFLMRPLGGIIYGHIGDRYGRRKALLSSIVLMTIPTVLLGLLPVYATVGVAASLLITFIRLLQGLAVGGEFTGSMVYLVETAPTDRRGTISSLALVGVLAGILLGVAIVALCTVLMSKAAMVAWGWRIPFLMGGLMGLIVFLLRRHMIETPAFTKACQAEPDHHTPLETCFLYYKKPIVQAFGITIFNAFAFYILMIYITTYFNRILAMSMEKSVLINFFMVGLTLLLVPVMGRLSDLIGHKRTLLIAAIAFIIISYPLNLYFLVKHSLSMFLLGQALICIFLAMYLGPLSVTLAELIPTRVRHTGLSIAYNTALALFGGTAPLVITYMIEKTNIVAVPGYLLTGSAVISLVSLLTIPELNKQTLK